jgi:outer membrane immunogenic protein
MFVKQLVLWNQRRKAGVIKKILLGVAMSLLVAAEATAADLSTWDWTGCYLGGNIGHGWSNTSFSDPALIIGNDAVSGSGVVGGGQIGCDYKAGPVLLGVRGTIEGTGITGSSAGLVTNSSATPWLATMTGRVGYTVSLTTLIYAKGGGTWVQNNVTGSLNGLPLSTSSYIAGGRIFGGGLEWLLLPHWSVFVEYDYLSFGSKAATFTGSPGNILAGTTFPINVAQNAQLVFVGMNFRF